MICVYRRKATGDLRDSACRKCSNKAQHQRQMADPAQYKKLRDRQERRNTRYRNDRQVGSSRPTWIMRDSLRSDRRSKRDNDLTIEFITGAISEPCRYCGDHEMSQMSLDRIDNSIGHITTNVVPSCIRCNLIRRDMPYPAWLLVARAVRAARDEGLLGDWMKGRLHRRRI